MKWYIVVETASGDEIKVSTLPEDITESIDEWLQDGGNANGGN
jgi:hypothetical protein